MKKIIFIAGAPGSGKSTLSVLLHKKTGFPVIDFGKITIAYLHNLPNEENPMHQKMSFEILVRAIECHVKYGFYPVIVNDLRDAQIQQIRDHFPEADYVIISLYVNDKNELEKRVTDESRDGTYRNIVEAWEWNRNLIKRPSLPNEHKIDNTESDRQKILDQVLGLLDVNGATSGI